MSKVDLGEMRPDYGEPVPLNSSDNKKKVKEYPSVYIKNPSKLGITGDDVGKKMHLEFEVRVKSHNPASTRTENGKIKKGEEDCQLELMEVYTEEDEEGSGDDIQDDITKGVKEAQEND